MTTTSVQHSRGRARTFPRAHLLFACLAALLAACGGDGSPTKPPDGKPPVDSTVPEPTVEARALWLSRYDYSTQAQLVALIDSAAAANFNLIYFQARGNGDAWYTPGLEPWGRQLTGTLGGNPGWDPLAVAVQRAHAKGLELHAWMNVAPGWVESNGQPLEMPQTTPPHPFLLHPEWIYKTPAGKRLADGSYELFTPAAAGYRSWVARIAADVVRRYAVDGIHLDYIRYPYPDATWADSLSLAQWQALPVPGNFDDYRRSLVTDIVRQVYDSMKAVRPGARLSAATWGLYKNPANWSGVATGYDGRLQDARDWANKGIIDALVPMVYWPIKPVYGGSLDFAFLADDHAKASVNGRHTYIGLDIENTTYHPLTSEGAEMVKEINRARYAGAIGVSVFSAQIMARNNWWHVLPQTVFKKKATVPPMSWK